MRYLQTSEITIPILIPGKEDSQEYVMALGDMLADGNEIRVSMNFVAVGDNARDLVAALTAGEPQALRFVAIPVSNRTTQINKEHI